MKVGIEGTLAFFFWPHHAACRTLEPRAGIEPVPLAVEAWETGPLDHQGSPLFLI